jgi:hypothetical protein
MGKMAWDRIAGKGAGMITTFLPSSLPPFLLSFLPLASFHSSFCLSFGVLPSFLSHPSFSILTLAPILPCLPSSDVAAVAVVLGIILVVAVVAIF